MKLLTRGMEWESIPSNVFSVNYHSKDSKYQIFKGKRPTDKFRLVAFDHRRNSGCESSARLKKRRSKPR